MRPQRADIAAPELPGRIRWLNADDAPRMAAAIAAGPVLVHFFDIAQLNSVRALPYVNEWASRYRERGLTVLGIHSPRFPFTARTEALAPALERLALAHPVADDAGYQLWHDYGCEGWPSLFLWSQGGALRWFHFGEGEYTTTEQAIREEVRELDPLAELPAPLEPLRPSDVPGALVVPPSAEIFPGGSASEPFASESLELEYEAGGAHASVDGSGDLQVAVDGGRPRPLPVPGPGLVDLAHHPRHEHHRLRIELGDGVKLYSVSFSAGVP